MTALKDTWQQQRRDRQQQVQTLLLNFQKTRQTQAAQQQLERRQFRQRLWQETATELAAIAHDRAIFSQQLHLDLQRDRQQLSSAVVSLRQNLASQFRSRQIETHSLLNFYQQERQQMRYQQAKELAAFVIFLQAEVQDYLGQLAAQRPIRAAETQQMLLHDRLRRQSAIETLFQELATFRAELRQYRQHLSQFVWGEETQADELPASLTAETISDSSIDKAESTSIEIQQVAIEPAESSAMELTEAAIEKFVAAEPVQAAPVEDPWIEVDQPTRALLKNEERVYDYLTKQQGARLTEIETLGLTRFQIVDALRSLTQKGLVWQRDRLYFAKD